MIEICAKSRGARPGLVLVTEEDYYEVLSKMLGLATKSVDLMAFSFVTGGGVNLYYKSLPFKIMTQLKTLRKKNIKVRVFLEGKRDTAEKNEFTAAHLRRGKIDVRLGSTHAKLVLVDGRYTLLGSSNLTDQSLKKNYETNLLFDGRGVYVHAARYFNHYWKGGAHGGVKLKTPLLADGDFQKTLVDAINRAKVKIDFAIYFFNQKEIEAALIAAARRGVKVSGLIHTHRRFGGRDLRNNHRTMARLRAAGLKELIYSPDSTFMHSKYLIADEKKILLGSGNWLDRDVTTHPQIYASLEDRKLGKVLALHLKKQMKFIRTKASTRA